MTRTIRGVLETPTLVRLDEPLNLPPDTPAEVMVRVEDAAGATDAPPSTFLELADSLQVDGPSDFSERWREYVAADERERSR